MRLGAGTVKTYDFSGGTGMRISRSLTALVTSTVAAASMLLAAPALAADPVVTPATPTIVGKAQFNQTLTAKPGAWVPTDVPLTYQWFRGATPVGTGSASYRLSSVADIGHRFTVRVTATGTSVSATSAPTQKVARATFTIRVRPKITGSAKYRKRLTASVGRWSVTPSAYSYQWLRNGKAISGARGKHHRVSVSDVGQKIRVRVTIKRSGYANRSWRTSAVTGKHVRKVRKTVTYSVITRGRISTSLATFKKQAQQTYDDPRGWRAMGVKLKRVKKGGDFTLVLAQASKVPSFSSFCSSTYSCRVGRYVVINQTRWTKATPVWKAKGGSSRDYRHMVVNHETGHWFERGHASCGGKGQLAPVMQQQSKGLAGCKINPWPKASELHSSRFGF